MRTIGAGLAWAVLLSPPILAQALADALQPVATMKQLMLDIIYPASNSIVLTVSRRGPASEQEWAEIKRSAMTLAESTNLLIMRNRTAAWVADARMLAEVGTKAYKAAEAKDASALSALTDPLDRSCTTCHKQFRPGVFPASR
jgi:hypothetical protein